LRIKQNDMTKLEQHRKTWQGKSDEWLFERLANELTQKVEEIHKLLAENEQLRLSNVVGRSEQLPCEHDYQPDTTCGVDITCCTKCGDVI
jgi:hypothetical protein